MDDKSQPSLLLSATLWWPAAARLAIAFQRRGFRVSAICPTGHPLYAVTGVSAIHRYRALSPTGSLTAAIRASQPAIVVPCDDGALWQLHELYLSGPEFRPLIERSLGAGEHFRLLEQRSEVLRIAAELGIRVPHTRSVSSPEDLNDASFTWPAVLKVDGTWGGEGVAVVRDRSEARHALKAVLGARRTRMAWKRFLINRHPLALWLWWRGGAASIALQEFVPGRQATTMLACWRGTVLASVTVEVLATLGPTGAATIVRPIENPEIERAARLLAQRFMLSGFHGLDFILEDGTGAAHMIEMNARATQLGHLNLCPQGSLADALAESVADPALVRPPGDPCRIASGTIAFFPQAWKADPNNPLLKSGYHDVPEEQPELVRELMRDTWPDRRLLNRIFEGLRRKTGNSRQQPPESRPESSSRDGESQDRAPQGG